MSGCSCTDREWTAAADNKFTRCPQSLKMGVSVLRYCSDCSSDDEAEQKFEPPPSPPSFNCLTKWPKAAVPVHDQGSCGSCWAHSAVTTLSFRFGIAGLPMNLSANPLINWTLDGHPTPNP